MIEVIVSTALLLIVTTGFMAMVAANGKILVRERRISRSSYELSAMAENGQGESGGEALEIEFAIEGRTDYQDPIIEIFEQYRVTQTWEGGQNSLVFYKYR